MATSKQFYRTKPKADEMVFTTRRLKRALHGRLGSIKAQRNGQRKGMQALVTIEQLLNEALEKGLNVMERGG